eukprot:86138-Hanusia_phi.AAC.1
MQPHSTWGSVWTRLRGRRAHCGIDSARLGDLESFKPGRRVRREKRAERIGKKDERREERGER